MALLSLYSGTAATVQIQKICATDCIRNLPDSAAMGFVVVPTVLAAGLIKINSDPTQHNCDYAALLLSISLACAIPKMFITLSDAGAARFILCSFGLLVSVLQAISAIQGLSLLSSSTLVLFTTVLNSAGCFALINVLPKSFSISEAMVVADILFLFAIDAVFATISFGPDLMHLSFSVALSVLIFIEYIRIFKVYPYGVALHTFMRTFFDQKDSGVFILSHIYLLVGCALPIWITRATIQSTKLTTGTYGVIVLGIADSCASIVGVQYGKMRWQMGGAFPSGGKKTVEGTLAFMVSMVVSLLVIRAVLGDDGGVLKICCVAVYSGLEA
ncbi:hypothetical protein HK100_012476 [Physocladia obscura]|uniref:dolichol kinase n=1 Tax=Physocladia obscura TaxID=109957 RepID=A0AAD5XKW6_9FUNG|nr:hypothetical protein HK100_012476 [Physocladia obscura]